MRYRPFGKDNISISEVGLGTWQLGSDWSRVDERTAADILSSAVDNGINFFDTSDVYGPETSELRIGRFRKALSERIFVATKIGRFPDPGWPDNFSLDVFRRHTEASLRRLDVDSLDLTQLHCLPPELIREGEVFEWLRILQREGKIQRFGASVESMDEALLCLEQEGLYSLQIIFNIFRQKPVDFLFEEARRKKVALIVRVPLASGLLAGKFTEKTSFPEYDHRNYNRDGEAFNPGETFAGLPFEKGVQLADKIKPLVPDHMTMAQFALRWILDFEAVNTVIPGATRPEQVLANAAVSNLPPLPVNTHETLRSFYESEVAPYIRGPY